MDHRLGIQPCLVSKEGILLVLAVNGNKTLMVLTVLATLCTGIGAEVIHIPNMGSPQIRTLCNALDQFFVVICLVFLGIVALGGSRGMPVQRLTAVLGNTDGQVGVHSVELIKPRAVHRGLAAIPTEIVVIGHTVGNLQVLCIHGAHRNHGHSGGTSLVHLMDKGVQNTVVIQQVGILLALHGDLVGQAPNSNTSMVVVLGDQLLHLADGILATIRHMLRDIGNFRPNHQAGLITQIIEILIVLIVSQTDSSSAYLADQRNVLCMVFFAQRVTLFPAILVTGNATQGVLLAIENEALIGINLIAAATETGRNRINYSAIFQQLCLCSIQVGILAAVPLMDIPNKELHLVAHGGEIGNNIAFFVLNGVADFLAICIGGKHLNLHICISAIDGGCNLDAGSAVVLQVKVRSRYCDQIHIPVQATIEGEVCHLGINTVIGGIVNRHNQQALPCQMVGHIYTPGRITAIVVSQVLAIHIHICRRVCAPDLQEETLAGRQFALIQLLCVVAGTAMVVITAILAVNRVPGMGQIHYFPTAVKLSRHGRSSLRERPLGIQIHNSSQRNILLIHSHELPHLPKQMRQCVIYSSIALRAVSSSFICASVFLSRL